ncbi:MAG: folylpolyglutamate synthase/dihydrofolate synthase family protein [Pseudomonadota bacterium]
MSEDRALEAFERLFGPEFGHGRAFDLNPLRAALAKLGAPQDKLPPVVHVAGTNGKGSTIAFMRAIAEAQGLRVHAFTKPHILHLRERFVVASEAVDEQVLISAADEVAAADDQLTQFDGQVAAAFLLFAETPADLVLLETGMGGRDDSTNIIAHPAATIITPIALDHKDTLGPTLAEIAAHKAGILKPGAPAIIARQQPEVMAFIEAHAEEIGAPLFRCGVEWDAFAQNGRLIVQTEIRMLDLPLPALVGAHQIENAGLACAAFLAPTGLNISDDAFAHGVAHASWPGRMQRLTRGRLVDMAKPCHVEVWIDGGHNAHAAQAMKRALAELSRKRKAKTALVVGLRARKDWRGFADVLNGATDFAFAVPLQDGAAPGELAEALGGRAAPNLDAAMQNALDLGAERVVICGSFALVAEALADLAALN